MLKNRQEQMNNRHKFQQGFTLAELLIVVAIIGILAAFGFVGIFQYQKSLHQKELDDTAREIFVAAQNHLTVSKANGEWDAYYQMTDENGNALSNDEKNQKFGQQMTEQPSDYTKDDFNSANYHDFRYFTVGSSAINSELQDYFLPKNAIDGTIMPSSDNDTHSIIIEYDAKTATVYGVWYTDGKNGWFGNAVPYNINDGDRNKGRPTGDTDTGSKKYRRNHEPQLGYYGGGKRKAASGKVSDPKVEIVNADRLYVRVKRDKDSSTTDADSPAIVIKFTGDTSENTMELLSVNKNKPDFYEDENKKVVKLQVGAEYDCYIIDSVTNGEGGHFASLFDSGKKNGLIPGENLTITVYRVGGTSVKYKTFHANSLFDSITDDDNTQQSDDYIANVKYGRQLQNLSTAVSGVKDHKDLKIHKANLTANINWSDFYFNEKKKNSNGNDVSENRVDKGHSINVFKNSDSKTINTGISAFYSIVNDNLEEFNGNNYTISNLQIQKDSDANGAGLFGSNHNHALTIHDLTMTDPSFTHRTDGTDIRYAGVLVGKNFADDNKTASLTIENVKVIGNNALSITGNMNSSEEEGAAGILVGHSSSSSLAITDAEINLKNGGTVEVKGGGNAGGLVGDTNDNQVSIEHSSIHSSKQLTIQADYHSGKNSLDNGNAGGAVGYLEYKNNYHLDGVEITSDDTLQVIGKRNAGGLIGVSKSDGSYSTAEIKNSAVYGGGDKDEVKGSAFVGGFAGYINAGEGQVSISDSLASMYVRKDEKLIPEKDAADANNSGAGGFIGTIRTGNDKSLIRNCYAGGRTTKGSYSKDTGEENPGRYNVQWILTKDRDTSLGGAGGFIGTFYNAGNPGKIRIENSYTTASVYANNNDAYIGSFGGSISDDYDVTLTETYSTGLVHADSPKYIGGKNGITSDFVNNYYLDSVNNNLFSDKNAQSAYVGEEDTPFARNKSAARPYDNKLDKKYPFKSVTSININQIIYYHVGDWPSSGNQDILVNEHTVQFFDEDGSPLTDVLHINQGASVRQQVPSESSLNVPKGKEFAGWYTDNTDFSNSIGPALFDNVTADIKAYAHYVTKSGYVTLHYVDPTDTSGQKIGTIGIVKINDDKTVTEPDYIRQFGGFKRDDDWNTSSYGTGNSYSVNNKQIQGVPSDVKDLYLRYHSNDMVTISLEIRATSVNYPQIYQSYVHEYKKGDKYTITQSLKDFEETDNNVEYEGLKKRILGNTTTVKLQDVEPTEATFDTDTKEVTLHGEADENTAYVVLYTAKPVTYTINHVFKDSIGTNGKNTLIVDNFNLADINSQMKYAKDQTFIVTETKSGTIGELVNLESELNAEGDTGFDISLQNTDFVLNSDNQVFTINYKRKKYQLTIDTNGAELVTNSPVSVLFGEDISATSKYLNGLPNKGRNGYTLQKDSSGNNVWKYTKTEDGSEYDGSTMPAENITATAQWNQNTTAPYTVEVWMQRVDDSQKPDMDDANKEYDFYGSFGVQADDYVTISDSWYSESEYVRLTPPNDVGTTPVFINDNDAAEIISALVNDKLGAKAKNDLKYFSVNTANTQNRNLTDSGTKVTIRPDGTTVYRVFYDRKTITFNFNYRNYKTQDTYQQLYIKWILVRRWDWGWGWYQTRDYSLTTNPSQDNIIYITDANTSYDENSGGNIIFTDPDTNQKDSLYDYYPDVWDTGKDANGKEIRTLMRRVPGQPVVETYSRLYGQEFSEAADIFNGYTWGYSNYSGSSTLTSLMNFILPGDDNGDHHDNDSDTTLTLNCQGEKNGSEKINHYQEALDGSWVLKTETKSYSNGNFNLTNKYDGFEVSGYAWGTYGPNIPKNGYAWKTYRPDIPKNKILITPGTVGTQTGRAQGTTLNIFHSRNKHTITLMNVNPMNNSQDELTKPEFTIGDNNTITVPYQEPLKDIGLTTDPETMKKYIPSTVDQNDETDGYTFGGWYTSASFAEGTEFNGETPMPNHNIRLYARWIAPKYTVQYMDGDNQIHKEDVERYNQISLVNADELTNVYRKDGYTFAGWYTNSDFSEGSEYLPSRAVTGNLTLYAKYTKAAGTKVTYTVKYVYDDGKGNQSEAAPPKTVETEIGQNYDEVPLDIPNAVCLDVHRSGRVTEELSRTPITFRYRMYAGSSWDYTVEDKVTYSDLDNKKTLEATIRSTEQSTSYISKNVNAENHGDFLLYGDESKTIKKSDKNKTVSFTYMPDYDSLKLDNLSTIYGDSKEPSFAGVEKWAVPEGWHFETRTTYKDNDGKELNSKPKNAGTYKADVSLYLVNGTGTMRLYTRENLTYRIAKRTVVLTLNNGVVIEDPKWADGEGATYAIDSESNSFTYTLNSGTSPNNYNIYRKFNN